MPPVIDPASVRAYVARDWQLLRTGKRAYWRTRLERGGLVEALAINLSNNQSHILEQSRRTLAPIRKEPK
jgi:hypothetical protein